MKDNPKKKDYNIHIYQYIKGYRNKMFRLGGIMKGKHYLYFQV